jgi:broad specificity phosphatase PhoE
MLRLLLARHGLTVANQQDRYIGASNPPLSDVGVAQAEALAARLAEEGLAAMYASPLLRARQTADIVARTCGLEVRIEPDLREIDFGCWEELTRAEILSRYPGQMQAWEADPAAEPAPHGGESLSQVARRVRAAYDEIVRRHDDGEAVLIVAHGGVLQALLCQALGPPLRARWSYLLRAAALSELWVFDGQPVLVSLNESCFLPTRDGEKQHLSG